MNASVISERDSYHQLGVLRTVHPFSMLRTVERCSSGRSVFFTLNSVGSKFGCLHSTPLSLSLYYFMVASYGHHLGQSSLVGSSENLSSCLLHTQS